MIKRTIVVNPVEPALLSMRSPLGIDLDLTLTFLGQNTAPVDPETLKPQLAMLPRSRGGIHGYDVSTTSSAGGTASVSVPGSALMDPSGYTLELYSRRAAQNPDDPPVPNGLLAKGLLALEGSAYQAIGPFAPIAVPVVVGPQGPQGEIGPIGPVGETGERGSLWTAGSGPPVVTGNELPGDMYLDEDNGDVWRFETATGWARQSS